LLPNQARYQATLRPDTTNYQALRDDPREIFGELESSVGYYALIKKGGKQFRRSLKTKDRKLAERRLGELKEKVGVLQITEDAHANFKTFADRWLDSRKHKLAESTAEWYGYLIKNLAEFFGGASIRNISVQDCERWAATRRKTAGTKAIVSELDTMNAVSTPDALFHPSAPLSAPQVPTEAMNSGPFRTRAFRSRLLDKSDQGRSSSNELKQESALASAIGKSPNMAK
jgi:hypothetical protein